MSINPGGFVWIEGSFLGTVTTVNTTFLFSFGGKRSGMILKHVTKSPEFPWFTFNIF